MREKGTLMTSFDDEFYRDILEGLATYEDSAFVRDVLATLSRHQDARIAVALNKNQMASKLWLADVLFTTIGSDLGRVLILGGWFGSLAAVLLHDRRFAIDHVRSVDIDPACAPIAESLNATHARAGKFDAQTHDMVAFDYLRGSKCVSDLVINTSCEHLANFDEWYARVPTGQLVAMQSNDYFACDEHVNCVRDLDAFKAQAPLRETLFAGERRMRRYTRFMLLGRK
jgi:hypothetical protein